VPESSSRLVAILAIFAGCGPASYAQQPITAAQALSYTSIGDLHFSPDGSKLAYVAASYRSDLVPRLRVINVATGDMREITPPGIAERAPQWSADGKLLAFLSTRAGRAQIFIMPADGGEPKAVTTQKFGVRRFRWSPNADRIAYLAEDNTATTEEDGPQVADLEKNLLRLWLVDVASRKTRYLGRSGYRIEDFQWQDPTHLLVNATDRPRVEANTNAIYSVSTADAEFKLVSHPPQPYAGLELSPDGSQFAVASTSANGPRPRDLFVGSIDDGSLRNASGPLGLAVAEIRWHEQSTIWLRVVDGFFNRLVQITANAAPTRIELPMSVRSFDVSHTGLLALAGEDFEHLPQIYLRNKYGGIRQLGDAQKGWEGGTLASASIFKTRTLNGLDIEAALIKPTTAAASVKAPLVLLVHGGPDSNFSAGYGWETAWAQMLVAHGYEVLMVNPRGSNGYSESFLKANRADWGGGDFKDLMTVLDAVIAKGETDPARLGIGGWSYGGEMSAWAITQTDRFKAAVAGACVFDQQAEFETEAEVGSDEWYFGTPWEHPEVFARNSPSTYIAHAHTPTLILDGEEDEANPVGQSKGLYRDLKHLGVETEMVLYPGEGHSPRRGSYNVDMFQRILDWYDRHLH
jgi:dipeptidyl aminopeptidase/acylaminoacyl peptidase